MAAEESTRFVIFTEDDMIVAMCLEQDIGAQGRNMDELFQRLKTAYRAERDDSIVRTGRAFGDVPPAPQRYHDMWDAGGGAVQCRRIFPLPDDIGIRALAA